jgi:hypothetical protein
MRGKDKAIPVLLSVPGDHISSAVVINRATELKERNINKLSRNSS